MRSIVKIEYPEKKLKMAKGEGYEILKPLYHYLGLEEKTWVDAGHQEKHSF